MLAERGVNVEHFTIYRWVQRYASEMDVTIGMFVAFGAFRGQFSDRVSSLTNFLLQLRMMSMHNERIADITLHPRENRKPDLPYEARHDKRLTHR